MAPPVLRNLGLSLATCLAAGGVASSQAPDALARIDALLEALEPPTCEALLEPFGPAPSIEELLEPRAADVIPVLRMPLPEGFVPLALELTAERDRLAVEDPEGAYALGLEHVEELTRHLGAQHPRVAFARDVLRGIELEAELALADRRALYAARAGNTEAARFHAAGRQDEALTRYLACAELELALLGEGARLGNALGGLAVILHARGDYARAERCARAGLERTLDALGTRHALVTRSLNDLALLLTAAGRLREAQAFHAHSLALRRELWGDDGPEFALALMHLVELYRFRNQLGPAAAVAERAIAILRERGAAPDRLGILLHQRGVLALMAGEDEEARALLEESIAVLERAHGGDHIELATALGALGDVESALGELERALALAEESVAMHERLQRAPHPLKAQARSRLGNSLAVVGELDRAERELRAALAEMEQTGVGGRELAGVLDTLASLLARKGDPGGAELQSARALAELRHAFGSSRLVANALRRRARRQVASGELDAAIATLRESAGMYVELLGPEHVRVAQVRVELAHCLVRDGQLEDAEGITLEVLGELDPGSASVAERRASTDANQLAARLALARGELERAATFARRAREQRSALVQAPHPELAEALALEGEVQERLGELEQARAAYVEALDQADSLRTRILGDERDRALYAGELSLGALARALGRVELALGHPRAALAAAERGRERALLDLLERSGRDLVVAARGEGAADGLELLLEREDAARRALLGAEQALRRAATSPAAAEEQLERLEQRVQSARAILRRREGELEAGLRDVWPSARPDSADALAAALDEDEALLHYGFDERGASLVVARRAEGVSWLGLRIADDADALRAELGALIEELHAGGAVDPRRRRTLSTTLLPPEVWNHLAGCRRVVIVPDGPLHGLPFEALDAPGGAWIEHGPRVVYSPSAALYARQRRTAGEATRPPARAVVLGAPRFADPDGDTPAAATRATPSQLDRLRLFGDRLEPLPGSAAEARGVSSALAEAGWEVALLIDSEARAPRLLELARGARLVHLATHGVSASAERPYEAGLALSAPAALSAEDDGFLTLDDLVRGWGGALAGCELVVLSACDTQVGVPLGESRVALSWGFFFAGARCVLVSLWKVDDRATALLMDRFYASYTGGHDEERELAGERFEAGAPMPADAALQEAKAWLARSTPAENRARLAALGLQSSGDGAVGNGERGGFPRPGAAPSSQPTEAAFDFRAPRFGAAFVLYGRDD